MRYLSDEASSQIDRVLHAKTDNFVELVAVAGLNPSRDFSHTHLRGVDFDGSVLTGFDFTGTVFEACKFRHAWFDDAKLVETEFRDCDPTDAEDWRRTGVRLDDGPGTRRPRQGSSVDGYDTVPSRAAYLVPAPAVQPPRIVVIGVGGAGNNALGNMIASDLRCVEFLAANTDASGLQELADYQILLGARICQGRGAGARPEIGRAAAEEALDEVKDRLRGVQMCFIAAGMGGGTGTGAAPVIARAARELGILTIGVVTTPFEFEGGRRARVAQAGVEEMRSSVDTLIVIPNQNLFYVPDVGADTTFKEAFELADTVLQQGVRCITDLMLTPGLMTLDFEDIREIMQSMGEAVIGMGEGRGDARGVAAARKAMANPLLGTRSIEDAKGLILSIVGGEDMRLAEIDLVAEIIRERVGSKTEIVWGSNFDATLGDQIRVTIIATGISSRLATA